VFVHGADAHEITVETYVWRAGDWLPTATRTFPRI
jgi:hypothetical protein